VLRVFVIKVIVAHFTSWGISVLLFLFNQRGQAPLPDLFYFLIQVPFDVCATENRTSQEEGLAPALTNRCVNAATH
jgi:hypothetical protein